MNLSSLYQFVVVQSLSCVWLFATPRTAACQASLSLTISWNLPKFMFIESVIPSNHLMLFLPLLLPSILPSIRVFFSQLALSIRWPNYWCFIFSITPSIEYSGLISFRMNWFDLLAVQGTLKSLLQHSSIGWFTFHEKSHIPFLSSQLLKRDECSSCFVGVPPCYLRMQ